MPARQIDPVYDETLIKVETEGVLVIAYQADVSPKEIKIVKELPVKLGV